MTGHSERGRQAVHIGVGAAAFLLRWLTWPQAIGCAVAAVLFNALVLPRIGGRALLRPHDSAAALSTGIVIYPISVLALVLAFPARPDLAASAWAILAAGDGAATLVGQSRLASGRWPWNPAKTYAGSAALFLAGGTAGALLMWWTGPAVDVDRSWWLVFAAPFAASLAAMFAETIPVRLDDNISVPFAAAMVLWTLSLVDPDRAVTASVVFLARLPAALAVNGAVALISWRLGAVSASGVVAGLAIGIAIWTGAGWQGWSLLFTAFLVASLASRLGLRRKQLLGIEQERGGRRGAGNALANCLLAAVAALAGPATLHADAALVVLVAALVTGASDTAASEIGKAWGRTTWSPLSLRRVAPGTVGGMSVEGTTAGLLAAAALAALASVTGLLPPGASWTIVVAAAVAMVVESTLGATLEPRGVLNNDVLNFIDTLVASAVALSLRTWMAG